MGGPELNVEKRDSVLNSRSKVRVTDDNTRKLEQRIIKALRNSVFYGSLGTDETKRITNYLLNALEKERQVRDIIRVSIKGDGSFDVVAAFNPGGGILRIEILNPERHCR